MMKNYRQLSNEYRDGVKEFGRMSDAEKHTAKGLKLIKRLKQIRIDIDQMSKENTKDFSFNL